MPEDTLTQALATTDPKTNGVAKRSVKQEMKHAVEINKREIVNALPEGYVGGADRFARTVLTCVARDPNLLKCSPTSVIGAAMQAAQLGLTPGVLGEAWLIPYAGECSFQLGYRGQVALAARGGFTITAQTVHANDEFEYALGLEERLHHVPATTNRGPGVYWYAIARERATRALVNFVVIDREHVEKRRKANRGKSPAWDGWYDEMAKSKAVKELCRLLPMSVEMAIAQASDGVVRDRIEGDADEYVADDFIEAEVVE